MYEILPFSGKKTEAQSDSGIELGHMSQRPCRIQKQSKKGQIRSEGRRAEAQLKDVLWNELPYSIVCSLSLGILKKRMGFIEYLTYGKHFTCIKEINPHRLMT